MRRGLVLLMAVVTAGLSGCGPDLEAAAIAAAKCAGALDEELAIPADDTGLRTSDVTVTGSDDERRVTGTWHHDTAGEGVYVCDVVPDPSDHLRGLRVVDLQLEPFADQPQ